MLLADEPTASLDEGARERFWAIVSSMRGAGRAVVLATQNPEEPARLADRIVALAEGRVVFAGLPSEFAGVEVSSA